MVDRRSGYALSLQMQMFVLCSSACGKHLDDSPWEKNVSSGT